MGNIYKAHNPLLQLNGVKICRPSLLINIRDDTLCYVYIYKALFFSSWKHIYTHKGSCYCKFSCIEFNGITLNNCLPLANKNSLSQNSSFYGGIKPIVFPTKLEHLIYNLQAQLQATRTEATIR